MNRARGSGGIPVRWRAAAPRRVCAGGGSPEGKRVTARPSASGTGGVGPGLRALARAGHLPRSRAAPPAPVGLLPGAPARPLPTAAARPSSATRPSSPGTRAGSRRAGAEPDAVSPVPAAAGTMGTPASVVSDPPGRATAAARGRKRASANIFQGVGLPELRSLFRSGGAERPEERARLVWRYAGQRRMARALRRLRRRRPAQPGGGMAALRRFSRLRIAEKEPEGGRGAETPSGPM